MTGMESSGPTSLAEVRARIDAVDADIGVLLGELERDPAALFWG
jgi:hypothetical protein